jgi:tRNA threonylcarbamoyladenosine biosynthesis protein TsaE
MISGMKIISHSEQQTEDLGAKFAKKLKGGEILALSGNLGAGKTCFSRGLAHGLGVRAVVNSPTFNILQVYNIKVGRVRRFVHIDAYRLKSQNDLINIGFYEYLDAETVIALEWPENILGLLPISVKTISIAAIDENRREISY